MCFWCTPIALIESQVLRLTVSLNLNLQIAEADIKSVRFLHCATAASPGIHPGRLQIIGPAPPCHGSSTSPCECQFYKCEAHRTCTCTLPDANSRQCAPYLLERPSPPPGVVSARLLWPVLQGSCELHIFGFCLCSPDLCQKVFSNYGTPTWAMLKALAIALKQHC